MTAPVLVRSSLLPPARAIPKSVTFTCPAVVMSTFPGFTSRWTTPFLCANASAAAMSDPMSAICAGAITPSAWIMSRSV